MNPNNFDVGIPSDAHKKLKFTSRGPGYIHILGSTDTEDWVKYIDFLWIKVVRVHLYYSQPSVISIVS